jgi:hypothetical protein
LKAPGFNLKTPCFTLKGPGFNLKAPGFNLKAPGFNLKAPGFNLCRYHAVRSSNDALRELAKERGMPLFDWAAAGL